MTKQHFLTLDGMRGVAAIAVVVFHLDSLVGSQLAPSGYLAVDLFFVLSGLVVAQAYEERLTSRQLTVVKFALIRMIRFWPLCAAGICLGLLKCLGVFITGQSSGMPDWAVLPAFVTGLLLFPLPVDQDGNLFPLNVPAWSLFFELAVNIFYAAVIVRLSTRTVALATAAFGSAFALSIISHGNADLGAWASHVGATTTRTLFSFGAGVLIHRSRVAQRPSHYAVALLAAVAVALVVPIPSNLRTAFDLAFVFAFSPALVLAGATFGATPQLHRTCVSLGTASFTLYALHYPLIWLARGMEQHVLPGSGPLLGAFLLIGLCATSPLITRYYDEPARVWLSRTLGFKTSARA